MDKINCVQCRDTGYVTYTDANCTTTCYCDCDAGTASYYRDEQLEFERYSEEFPYREDD